MDLPDLSGTDAVPPDRRLRFDAPTVDESSLAIEGLGPRYARKAFHAQGGIGEVWRCLDSRLGREIALKVLRRDGQESRARFVAEAQITGQLEHPNIVPVHDVGLDEARRPYYVMKFVRGTTLKQAIAEYHSTTTKPPAAAARRVQFVRLLQIFIDVCHAVAYAHSRRVIHRDLKPANVMLGSYGETLVLDWGVAKVLGNGAHDGELRGDIAHAAGDGSVATAGGSALAAATHSRPSVVLPFSADGSPVTGEGTMLGTPAYMAPEMASGHPEALDELTDVFLLGATLYDILTGHPPRQGRSHDDIVEMVRSVPPPPARRLEPDCPRALEAIATKAMAMRPQDRYPSAMDLAAEVQRFLADEPVSACTEPLAARLWRWSRRHRVALARMAAALFVLAAAVTAIAALRHARTLRREAADLRTAQRARDDLKEFRRLADDARYLAANSDPISEHAPYFDLRAGQSAAEAALAVADRWHDGVSGWPLAREPGADLHTDVFKLILLTAQVRALRGEPLAPTLTLMDRAAAAAAVAPGASMAAYHRVLATCYRTTAPARAAEEERLAATEGAAARDVEDAFLTGERFRQQTAAMTEDEQERWQRSQLLTQALESYRSALLLDPNHYWAHFQAGRCLLALGRMDEAVAELGACVALRPNEPWAYSARGLALTLVRQLDAAGADLDRAVSLRPDFRPALLNRGLLRMVQHNRAAALSDFEAALAPPATSRLTEAAFYRAELFLDEADYQRAVQDLLWVEKERKNLREIYPLRMRARLMLGDDAGFWSDADALASSSPLTGREDQQVPPDTPARRVHVLAKTLPSWPDPDNAQAREEFTKRVSAVAKRALADAQAEPAQGRRVTATFLADQASLAADVLKDHAQATSLYTASLALRPDDATNHQLRGQSLLELHNPDLVGAQADFRTAARLFEAAAPPHTVEAARAHAWLGIVLARQSRPEEEATDEAAAAMALAGGDVTTLHNIACVYAEAAESKAPKAPQRRDVLQRLAMKFLARAIHAWRDHPTRADGYDELRQLQDDSSLASIRARPDFPDWLAKVRSESSRAGDRH